MFVTISDTVWGGVLSVKWVQRDRGSRTSSTPPRVLLVVRFGVLSQTAWSSFWGSTVGQRTTFSQPGQLHCWGPLQGGSQLVVFPLSLTWRQCNPLPLTLGSGTQVPLHLKNLGGGSFRHLIISLILPEMSDSPSPPMGWTFLFNLRPLGTTCAWRHLCRNVLWWSALKSRLLGLDCFDRAKSILSSALLSSKLSISIVIPYGLSGGDSGITLGCSIWLGVALIHSIWEDRAGRWQGPPSERRTPLLPSSSSRLVPLSGSSVGDLTAANNKTWELLSSLLPPSSLAPPAVLSLIAGPVRHRHCPPEEWRG